MKKSIIFIAIIGLLLVILPLTANAGIVASGTYGNGVSWKYSDDGILTISGYGEIPDYQHPWKDQGYNPKNVIIDSGITRIGTMSFYYYENYEIKSITIPDTVVSIDISAFEGCGLTNVFIPESVTYIGEKVFMGCMHLTEIIVSEANTEYTSIDGVLYDKQVKNLICCPAMTANTEIIVPANVTTISDSAFYFCRGLTNIVLNEGITNIGSNAFSGCSNLESINLPDTIEVIPSNAFNFCSKLSRILLPSSIKSIERNAFYCAELNEIVWSEGIESIGESAFYGNNFTELIIPESVKSIGNNAFEHNWNLISITFPKGLSFIGTDIFQNCSESLVIKVPEGTYAEDYVIQNGLNHETIKEYEYEVVNQQAVITGYIGNETIVDIPKRLGGYQVYKIASGAFEGCDFIDQIIIRDHITEIGTNALPVNEIIQIVCYKNSAALTYAVNNQYSYIIIRKIISSGTFDSNISWTMDDDYCLIIEGSGKLENGGSSLFYDTGCTDVIVEEGITTIGFSAFSGCRNLKTISLPDSLTEIKSFAFENCVSLTEINLPDRIKTINYYTFYNCNAVRNAALNTDTAMALSKAGISFHVEDADCNFRYVFDGEENLGITIADVPNDLTVLTIPDYVTRIEIDSINTSNNLQIIYFPDNINYIYQYALYKCAAIRYVNPDSITAVSLSKISGAGFRIGGTQCNVKYIFDGEAIAGLVMTDIPTELESLEVPEGVTEIQSFSFDNNNQLKTVSLPQSMVTLRSWAFSNCSNLENIIIQEGLSTIESLAFYRCGNLLSINLPSSVQSADGQIFSQCYKLTEIHIPSCGSYAYEYCRDDNQLSSLIVLDQPHESVYDEEIPATCTSTGLTDGFHCSICGDIISGHVTIPKLAHTIVIDEAVAATDEEPGLTEGSHCSVCGTILVPQEVVPCAWSYWTYEVNNDIVTIQKYTGTDQKVIVPSTIYGHTVNAIAENAFDSANCPERVYIPSTIDQISSQAFTSKIIVYCEEYSEADYWAEETGYQTIYTNNVSGGDFYLIELQNNFRLLRNDSAVLNYSIWPLLNDTPIIWNSSSPDIIRVENGMVTALLPGTATIVLQAGGVSASVEVTGYGPPDSFELSETELVLATRTTGSLSVIQVEPTGSDMEIEWSSSNTAIAIISEDGVISARRPGSAVITATSQNGICRECNVTVCNPIVSVEFDAETYFVKRGETSSVIVTVTTSDGTTYQNKMVSFFSSDEGIFIIDKNGNISGEEIGEATITAYVTDSLVATAHVSIICPNHHAEAYPEMLATCTEEGHTGGSYCPECLEEISPRTIVPATGHTWSDVEYNWSATDTIIAKRVCGNDAKHVETETVSVSFELLSPTETTSGSYSYVSDSFENPAFSIQSKSGSIPALNDLDVLWLPDGLKSIDAEAFMNSACQAVILPQGCISIEKMAFARCSNLVYVRIPYGCHFEEDTFSECPNAIIDYRDYSQPIPTPTPTPATKQTISMYNYAKISVPATFYLYETTSQNITYRDTTSSLTLTYGKLNFSSYSSLKSALQSAYGSVSEITLNGINMIGIAEVYSTYTISGVAFMVNNQALLVTFLFTNDSEGQMSAECLNSIKASASDPTPTPTPSFTSMTFFNNVICSVPNSFYPSTVSSGKTYYMDTESDIIMDIQQNAIVSDYEGLLNLIQSRYSRDEYAEFTNDNGVRIIFTIEDSSSSTTTTWYFISNNKLVYFTFVYSTSKAETISTNIIDSIYLKSK